MWWVGMYLWDELLVKYTGPFSSQDEAESYVMMIAGDGSDYSVYKEEI